MENKVSLLANWPGFGVEALPLLVAVIGDIHARANTLPASINDLWCVIGKARITANEGL